MKCVAPRRSTLFLAVRPLLFAVCVAAGGLLVFPAAASAASPGPWLFVSDLHFDPTSESSVPSSSGEDTNRVLLRSSIAEMKRVDPAPPVVVITGDFLAHHFDSSKAEATMIALAVSFNAAFPHAQFVIALGNEDSACGDYALSAHAPFLQSVAAAWEPMVNRRGAAPQFARTFSRDGFYVTTLPIPRLQAVVIDDVFWSPRFRTTCGGMSGGDRTTAELRAALGGRPNGRKWVVAHIPPGIDAYSTVYLVHQLVDVPFLNPAPRQQLMSLVDDPRSNVVLVLAAHTHKFAYRFDARAGKQAAPILLVPSISPIFSNAPSFLTVNVRPDGAIGSADVHALLAGRWRAVGGTRALGLSAVTTPNLFALQARLAHDPKLRQRFARLYEAGARPEIDERNWRSYWCAATEFAAGDFRSCLGHAGGVSLLTRRGALVVTVGAAFVVAAVAAGGIVVSRFRRRRTRTGA